MGVVRGTAMWKLAMCPKRWRLKVEENDLGAYHNWTVVLFAERQKLDGFTRCLREGGATVYGPDATSLCSVSYALAEEKSKKFTQEARDRVLKAGVKCMKMEWLCAWLIDDPPKEEDYFMDIYKRKIQEIKAAPQVVNID